MVPKKFHGPELKCGGPSMCNDCKERIALKRKTGLGSKIIRALEECVEFEKGDSDLKTNKVKK